MKTASVLVDNRPIAGQELIIQDHMRFLKGWDSIVFGHRQCRYLKAFCTKFIEIPDIHDFNGYNGYSNFLLSMEMWKHLESYDRVLIYQYDSKLLRDIPDHLMQWDWIGAPWAPRWGNLYGKVHPSGQGGLCIRNPKAVILAIAQMPVISRLGAKVFKQFQYRQINVLPSMPYVCSGEDIFLLHLLQRIGANVAPLEAAREFSCERYFQLGTVGCHAIHKYMTEDQVIQILTQYER